MSASLIWFRRVCWLGVVIWASTIFYLSSLSPTQIEDMNKFELNDKICHFIAFFAGATPLIPAFRLTWRWPWRRAIIWAILCLSTYGALDEFHQQWTPGRSALDPYDWTADTVGAIFGAFTTALIHAYFERKNRPAPAGN